MGLYTLLLSFVVPLFLASSLLVIQPESCRAADEPSYVGSKACSQCHEKQYENFSKYSKKAHAWDSIAIMKPKLKEQELKQCYECHTTGYGRKGGFVSKEATPHLADVGCESCHGPGGEHAASGDPKQIRRRPAVETCTACHNPQRVEDFNFKPLLFSGAH
ncbi:multiheme c-type cytochrome [Fundidesulfovibrio putealis]|uniref:multiheme c-type cytochrome n=1 Tax=Fundidesulfovibrio putealis TaxID=270496 RepID=UPI003898F233